MRKKEPLISIIIPVYNGERFIERCVAAILSQSYQNFEIIMVNDGSKDKSQEALEKIQKTDKRIIVLKKENGGASSARNMGLDRAKGEYISFVDIDDIIAPMFLEKLLKNAQETGADLSVCNYSYVQSEDGEMPEVSLSSDLEIWEGDRRFEWFFDDKFYLIAIMPCNKLYKKEIFADGLRFPEGVMCEDEFITHKYLNASKKVVYDDSKLYYYFLVVGSVMNRPYTKRNLVAVEALSERADFLKTVSDEFYNKALSSLFSTIVYLYFKYKNGDECQKILIEEYKTRKKQHKAEIKKFSFKRKLKMFLFERFRFVLKIFYKKKSY